MPPNLDTDLHFTCFVAAPSPSGREEGVPVDPGEPGQMRLLELDGRRAGPIDRGACTDFLKVSRTSSDGAGEGKERGCADGLHSQDVSAVVREFYISQTASTQFSLIALSGGPALD